MFILIQTQQLPALFRPSIEPVSVKNFVRKRYGKVDRLKLEMIAFAYFSIFTAWMYVMYKAVSEPTNR